MEAILISIKPKWCELIASGKKTIEVRKTKPKLKTPFKCYIYQSHGKKRDYFSRQIQEYFNQGKVIGEFVCDSIDEFSEWQLTPQGKFQEHEQNELDKFLQASCLTREEVCKYRNNLPYYTPLYGWHISDLKIYDKPKELGAFWAYNKKWHECFEEEDGYCCYDSTNEYGECLIDCVDSAGVKNCYLCWEEWSGWCHRITRPPQSWCYCEELEEV